MNFINTYYLILFFILTALSCSREHPEETKTRTFYMGTTPFPADISLAEVDKSYNFINQHCDIISQHINDGIPYEEFYAGLTLPQAFVDDMNFRKYKTPIGKKIFLSVGSLDLSRINKDIYYPTSSVSDEIKSHWTHLNFDDPKMISAYVNYINWLISHFNPIYVNYGVESNSFNWDTTNFHHYKNFLTQVYQQLKTAHPTISFFVSFIVDNSAIGLNNAEQLIGISDFIGLSVYPYGVDNVGNSSNPELIPSNFFERYIQLAPNKPLAIAETGYIAQDLIIPAYGLYKQGSQEWQNQYLKKILDICTEKKAVLLIWFCPKDYDAMMNTIIQQGNFDEYTLNLLYLWRDTGLIDENDQTRQAYSTWLENVQLPKE
jgi:hypothetical protein